MSLGESGLGRPGCLGRERYADRAAAARAWNRSQAKWERKNALRAETCPDCHGWHLQDRPT